MLNMNEFEKAVTSLEAKGIKLEVEPHRYGPGAIAKITSLPGCDFAINLGPMVQMKDCSRSTVFPCWMRRSESAMKSPAGLQPRT